MKQTQIDLMEKNKKNTKVNDWLPAGKKAAICFSIDDIHPQTKNGYYEAGGDLNHGSLGKVQWLINRHPQLKVTLFVTADWRETSPVPTRIILANIPFLRNHFYLSKRLKQGSMRLDKHQKFVFFLNNNPNFEVALHGLHHCHKGLNIPVEFQNQTQEEFEYIITKMLTIFDKSKLHYIKGMCPPGWNAPNTLLNAMIIKDIRFVSSARDVNTTIEEGATTNMSGIKGEPLIFPSFINNGKLIHFPCNFQATSNIDRAIQILEHGGLLSIKAHIIEGTSLDSIGWLYMNYLDILFSIINEKYGDSIWWTSMGEMEKEINKQRYLKLHEKEHLYFN